MLPLDMTFWRRHCFPVLLLVDENAVFLHHNVTASVSSVYLAITLGKLAHENLNTLITIMLPLDMTFWRRHCFPVLLLVDGDAVFLHHNVTASVSSVSQVLLAR